MSTTSAKNNLNDAAASSRAAAEDLKAAGERNLNDLRSKIGSTAEANAKDLRSKAEANVNSLRSQLSSAESEAKAWGRSAEKEAKSWGRSAEKEATSWGKSAEKEAKSWGKSAEKDAKSWGNSAEKEAKSWASSAEEKASSLKSQAESGFQSWTKEAQNSAASLQSSAERAASDLKSKVTGINVTDPNAWVPKYSPTDYLRFFSAGALCATITHGAMTPVDVVKTRLQLEPKGSKLNMVSMARNIVATEGASGLMTGFGPTAVGYLIQGGSKFCGFEYFKQKFAIMAGSREVAENNRTLIYMGAASSAELIASTLLTPLEAARIRLVSQRGYANGLAGAMTRMGSEGGIREFYAGYAGEWPLSNR